MLLCYYIVMHYNNKNNNNLFQTMVYMDNKNSTINIK